MPETSDFDNRRYVRFGRYVGERTEGTPTPWSGSVHTGAGRDLVRKAAKILNPERPAPRERPAG